MRRQRAGESGAVPWLFVTNCWRAHRASLVMLALLVGLTGGVAMAAIAGARRSASSPSRFHDVARSRDVFVGAEERPELLDEVLEGPLVEDHLDLVFVFAFAGEDDGVSFFAPTDPGGADVERGVLVDGRRPDPADPDEIAVSETTARQYDLEPGDTFDLITLTPEQAVAVFEGVEPTSADGPELAMRVTGVVRTEFDLAAGIAEPSGVVFSPAFLDRYGDTVGLGTTSHMVRLVETPDAVGRFTDQLEEVYAGGQQPGLDVNQGAKLVVAAIDVITAALVALSLVVAVPGLAWAAVIAARQQRLSAGDLDVLRALGSTRSERQALAFGAVAPALVAGAVLAPAVAIALSPLFPVGLARRFDPDPGLHADVAVLVAGSLVLLLVLGVAAAVSGRRVVDRAPAAPVPSRVPRLLDRVAGRLAPTPATGVRFALSTPRSVSTPVRPALLGACLGVVGLVAVAVGGSSLDRLVDTPARWGAPWDVAVDAEGLDREREVLDNPDIGAAVVGRFDEQVIVEGHEALAVTVDPVKGELTQTVVHGREPRGDDEVAVGPETLDELGVPIGAAVDISSRSATSRRFRIVGTVLYPTVDMSFPLAAGASFTLAGGDRLKLGDPARDDVGFERLLIRWAPDVDGQDALARLGERGANVARPVSPPEVNGLRDVRLFPAVAAAGLVLLGVVSTSHALAVTVRRRRVELGVLSALGFTPRQRRLVIAVQATAIATVAVIVGVPLGIVAGRLVWSTIAGSMGVATDAALPVALLAAGAGAVVVILNLIGAVPARSAARLPVAATLRSE